MLRVDCLGFRVEGLGLRVLGLGFRVEGIGLGVEGLGVLGSLIIAGACTYQCAPREPWRGARAAITRLGGEGLGFWDLGT